MSDFRFYAACLASYNAGILHGAWIDASDDVEAMHAEIKVMLASSPGSLTGSYTSEEWAIHDYDGAVPHGMGEFAGLALIAEWVGVLAAAEDAGMSADVAKAVAENYGEPHNGEFAETLECLTERYCGEHDSLTAYAESYISDTGMLDNVNSTIASYFDFEAFGRDLQLGGDVFTVRVDGALHVFNAH